MMNCPNCNKEIPEGKSFCPECGAPLNPAQGMTPGMMTAMQPVKQKKPITKKWWFWVIIALVVIVIIGSAASGGEEEKAPAAAEISSTTAASTTEKETTTQKVTTTEAPTLSEGEYKASCEKIAYKDIARQPDLYEGKNVVFTGEVIQVQESSWSNETIYRINVTRGEYDIWEDTVYVTYKLPEGAPHILEDDIVTFYGVCEGTYTYTSVLGSNITIPSVDARYIDIQ